MKAIYYAVILFLLGVNVYVYLYKFDYAPQRTITGSIMDIQNLKDDTYILTKDKTDYYLYKINKEKIVVNTLNVNDDTKLLILNNELRIITVVGPEIVIADVNGNRINEDVKEVLEEPDEKIANIIFHKEAKEFETFEIKMVEDSNTFSEYQEKINTAFSKINKAVFNLFKTDFNIYLVSDITAKDKTKNIEKPAAFTYFSSDEYGIVVNISDVNFEETIYHELYHVLENFILSEKTNYFDKWNDYNEKDFTYCESYTSCQRDLELDKEDTYFLSEYSLTYAAEDRAVIFARGVIDTGYIDKYSNIKVKYDYLLSLLNDFYNVDILN